MSMHLCGPALTTTSYKKRKQKVTKAQQEEFERGWKERNIRLKEMGLPKETLEQYTEWVHGRGKKEKAKKNNRAVCSSPIATSFTRQQNANEGTTNSSLESKDEVPWHSNNNRTHGKIWVTGPCTTKQTPTYTGTKIIGIGTMHKSNAVPIFSDEEAKDISKMRR